ncbi:MAG: hypothetical protein AAFZ46_12095 [Pseudomonadota bacterium]
MARPRGSKKPEHQRRTEQLTFWVTPSERARIAANADRAGVTMSAFIRSLALGKKLRFKPSEQTAELTRELNAIAINLKQLLGHAQKGQIEGAEHIEHVTNRVLGALELWATEKASSKPIAPEAITLMVHEGTKLNGLARQANRREPVTEKALLAVLNDLTATLRPFCP